MSTTFTDELRTSLTRTIAESDITDGELTNEDIDQLVDLFEAWFERNMTIVPEELWREMVKHIAMAQPAFSALLTRIEALDPQVFVDLGIKI